MRKTLMFTLDVHFQLLFIFGYIVTQMAVKMTTPSILLIFLIILNQFSFHVTYKFIVIIITNFYILLKVLITIFLIFSGSIIISSTYYWCEGLKINMVINFRSAWLERHRNQKDCWCPSVPFFLKDKISRGVKIKIKSDRLNSTFYFL